MTVDQFNAVCREACEQFGGSETSGHRTPQHNGAVGGAPDSQHLGWKCKDIVLDDSNNFDLFAAFLKSRGFWVEPKTQAKDHIHVDDRFAAAP